MVRIFLEIRRILPLVLVIVAWCSVLFPGAASAENTPWLVYPPDGALLSGDGAVTLLGFRGAGPQANLTVITGSGPTNFPVGPGAFSIPVTLAPGENIIRAGEKTVKVFLAAGDAKPAPDGFAAPDTHAVDNGCTDCHTFAGDAVKLVDKPPALCNGCHDDVLKGQDGKPQAVLHPPAEEDCLGCHALHGFSIKALPAAAKRDLCFGCHDDFTAGGTKRMHAPVAKGECTGCHNPHGAAGEKLLAATGLKLCVLCHTDPSSGKEGKEWAVAHPALDDGCPSCHLPHVSDAPRLLKKGEGEVCADCHDPFPKEEGGKQLLTHSPVEEGECGGCHAVHGSDEGKLLRKSGKALCVTCHDDPTLAPDGKDLATPHPALDDGCLSCHLPHVAPAGPMLKKAQAPLCFDCHDAFRSATSGGSSHQPAVQGKCNACHLPHGSAAPKLLSASGQALCLTCHKDPARTPDGEAVAAPHAALDDGCTPCHQPHVADAPRLLGKQQPALCADCHEDKNVNGEGQEWESPHQPVKAGLCTSCHAPHGSQEPALLTSPPFELCQICHTEVHARHLGAELDPITGQPTSDVATLPKGFPVRKKDGSLACVGCHRPHGSDNVKMWPMEEMMFCSQCHTKF